jgi:uncharacterized protein
MQVRLEQVRDRPFHWDETETIDAAEVGHPDVQALSPVHWRGEIRFADPGYLLTATYSYTQTLSCQRCLEPLEQPVEEEMTLLLVPGAQAPASPEHELAEEELGVVEVPEDGDVDLRPLLVEQIQLNVPMRPLCKADCAGLCPTCGKNLNDGPCGCEQKEIDPRWKALEAFRGSGEPSGTEDARERQKDH